jgi:transcriptional regulator NrdR family protein
MASCRRRFTGFESVELFDPVVDFQDLGEVVLPRQQIVVAKLGREQDRADEQPKESRPWTS